MIATGILSQDTVTTRVEEIKARKGPAPWSERIVANEHYAITAICQPPGQPNDHHYHLTDEVWYIYEGELTWQYEHAPEPHPVKAGDFVFAPRNLWHHIEVLGDKPSIRIAITPAGEFHRYDRPGCRQLEKK